MAHWIIDDRGFGGTYYSCSECKTSYCDIFKDVCGENKCPNCGAPIDEEANIYMKNGKVESQISSIEKFELGDSVCSLAINTLSGTVTDIINDENMIVKVTSVHGVKSIIADMKYWKKY